MSVEELVKELRQVAAFPRPIHKAPSLMEQAADRLEELSAALRIAQGNTDAAIEDYNEAQAALAEAKRENEALREACNQSRLAFAGMVSVQSAIDKLDTLPRNAGGKNA